VYQIAITGLKLLSLPSSPVRLMARLKSNGVKYYRRRKKKETVEENIQLSSGRLILCQNKTDKLRFTNTIATAT
jgi:hypothetical protein